MNWRFWKKEWEIKPVDIHWNGFEASFIVRDGWDLFGVTPVPNTLEQNLIRLWLRRPTGSMARVPYEVKIQSAGWGGHEVILHLSAFWKPFGVSTSYDNHIIWFRRPA